jgi:osmotically-inducible protein OsmY
MPLILTQKLSLNPADSELARRVGDELATFCRGLRCIEVSAEDGTITLSGPVKTYYSRQMAVVTANRVGGVHRVIDNLDVKLHPLAAV